MLLPQTVENFREKRLMVRINDLLHLNQSSSAGYKKNKQYHNHQQKDPAP